MTESTITVSVGLGLSDTVEIVTAFDGKPIASVAFTADQCASHVAILQRHIEALRLKEASNASKH